MRTLLFTLLCTCASAQLFGQRLRIEYFTVNDGLSAREINDFHIGEDGFLWVATMDGLNRFDGQGFTRFGVPTDQSPGLSNHAVDRIGVDNEGQFVLTFRDFYGYFDRFDPASQMVEQVELVPSSGVLGYPRTIVTDHFGRVFAVTIGPEGTFVYEYTPNRFNPNKQFTVIYHEPYDAWTTLAPRVELLPLSNGQLLLYDDEHGFRYLSATGKLIGQPFEGSAGQRRFYTFAEAADGLVYFSFRMGVPLYRWEPGVDNQPVPVAGLDAGLRYPDIKRDEKGQLLIYATEDILGDAFPQEFYLVDHEGNFSLFEEPMPTGRAITAAAALDFNETIYLGLRDGLGVIERYTNSVKNYLTASEDDKLGLNSLGQICEDTEGNVYVIEGDGFIYSINGADNSVDTLRLTSVADSTKTIGFRAGTGLIYDRKRNSLWATAQPLDQAKGGLLIQYNLGTKRTKVYESENALGALTQDARGRTYIAASHSGLIGLLVELEESTQSFLPVRVNQLSTSTVRGFRINHLSLSSTGELLLGTENRGLLSVSVEDGNLKFLTESDRFLPNATIDETIFAVYEDEENWWLGTDNGLRKVPRDTLSKEERYNRGDGLSSNVVRGIVPDESGGLWLSTGNGLTHIPPTFNQDDFRRYYREDGLAADEFNLLSYHRDATGQYYFGGKNGLTVFREGDFSIQTSGADVMITEVDVYGRENVRVINTNLDQLKQVTVFASEKSVAVSFALPAGQLPSSTQFRYRLEGFNEDWVALTNERTIRFNNLAAGNYKLRIQGAGANGNFGDREKVLSINVRQYLLERLWFQALLVFIFALLIFWILQSKLRERLRNEQLRSQLSSDIHDEVSGLLAGITLQAELIKNRTNDDRLKEKLDRVGEASRSAMSKMSDVIWSIDSRRDTVGNLLQRMQEHADEVLLPIDIRYNFSARGFDEQKELAGNIRQDLYFIYKEAINNIARHSNATNVDIEVTLAGQVFELFVRDNGSNQTKKFISFPTASKANAETEKAAMVQERVKREKSGQGKENMKMRAERLKGEITIDDRYGYTLIFKMRGF